MNTFRALLRRVSDLLGRLVADRKEQPTPPLRHYIPNSDGNGGKVIGYGGKVIGSGDSGGH